MFRLAKNIPADAAGKASVTATSSRASTHEANESPLCGLLGVIQQGTLTVLYRQTSFGTFWRRRRAQLQHSRPHCCTSGGTTETGPQVTAAAASPVRLLQHHRPRRNTVPGASAVSERRRSKTHGDVNQLVPGLINPHRPERHDRALVPEDDSRDDAPRVAPGRHRACRRTGHVTPPVASRPKVFKERRPASGSSPATLTSSRNSA